MEEFQRLDPQEHQTKKSPRQNWLDLSIYIVGGYGGFILLSVLISLVFADQMLESTILLTIISSLVNIIAIGGSFFLLGVLRKKTTTKEIGLWPIKWKWQWILPVILVSILLNPVRMLAAFLVQQLIEPGMESLQARADIFTAGGSLTGINFFISLLGIGILAPMAEELFFRGLIQGWFRERYTTWIAICCSSVLFGLAHFDSPGVLISSLIMGFALGYLYERYQSIWAPISLHIITNSSALVLVYIANSLSSLVM